MENTIQKLLAPGKGILAADESTGTITKRFAAIGLTSTPELNKKYREMLFTTPGIEEFLSGVILFDESVRQNLHKILEEKGITPGIKVDRGLEPFNDSLEQITKGLEGLDGRLKGYAGMGLKFTKWRAAVSISNVFPTDTFLDENLNRLAEFVGISQRNGFVPIPEPEILLNGNHTAAKCEEICIKVWKVFFEKLRSKNIDLTKLILKTSMVLPGKDSGIKAAPLEVAASTLRALLAGVPKEVPGVVFLSGGQTPDEATYNLNEIVKMGKDVPYQLSFSFSRALQEEAMATWAGEDENTGCAQEVFLKRLEMVSKARKGEL